MSSLSDRLYVVQDWYGPVLIYVKSSTEVRLVMDASGVVTGDYGMRMESPRVGGVGYKNPAV